ncbi:MAG: radical SAM protein [Candidatus Omnitrophica bacterium]|nr:radical SAM protein [Candidatus Omnitrophota bacterium]
MKYIYGPVKSRRLGLSDILAELKSWLKNNPKEAKELSYITLSGAGEPTLNSKLGELIAGLRKISRAKIAVITNSALLAHAQVRAELKGADLIVPSLDAVDPQVFAKIDRPHPEIKLEEVIEGLVALRKEFRGKFWLEVMLISGINDGIEHINRLKKVIDRINPDKIQLNSPVRTTTESGLLPVDRNKLEQIKKVLGAKAEII